MMILSVLAILLLLFTVNYSVIILMFRSGVRKLKNRDINEHSGKLRTLTVIVSARNEENNIGICLESLVNQQYPKEKYEVIIVDDQSTDNTALIIQDFITTHPYNFRMYATSGLGGKKEAFNTGIKYASGEIILTTDADCVVSPDWMNEMNKAFNGSAVFVAGPVMMAPSATWFEIFQCLEFNALLASTAGSFGINRPVMSNGANMGILAEVCRTEMMNPQVTSGEDVFTMFYLKKKYGARMLKFAASAESVVRTQTQKSLRDFIMQRIRWTSKSSSYTDGDTIYVAISVMGINLLLLTSIIFSLAGNNSPQAMLLQIVTAFCLVSKTVVDYLLLSAYSSHFGQFKLVKYLPLAEILVVFYTAATGLAGIFLPYSWKGRKYKK